MRLRCFQGLGQSETRSHPAVVMMMCLSLALAVWARPTRAAFEIRPSSEFPSPLLPSLLPTALASAAKCPALGRTGWSAAALHLTPEPAARLYLDAAGLRVDGRRWMVRAEVTRLGLPDYAEWEADVCLASTAGLAFEAGLFRTQPSDLLRSSAGIESRGAASLGASWAKSFGWRMTAAGWVRDIVGAGDRRALGITARAGGRLDFSPIGGWTASLLREWGGHSRPHTRMTLGWRPFSGWRLEHVRAPGGGGESTGLKAELGGLEILGWSGRLASGLPSVPGFAIGCRQEPGARGAPTAHRGEARRAGEAVPADSSVIRPLWEDWEREPGDELLVIDGRAVPAGSEADSLGAWVDSLEDGISARAVRGGAVPDRTGSGSSPAGPVPRGEEGRRVRLVPWSHLRAEDIPEVNGADIAARDRFLAAAHSDGPRAISKSLVGAPDPILRRLLLATAPYASAGAPLPSFTGIESVTRSALRWRREIRSSAGRPARAADRWELHGTPAGVGVHAAARRPAGVDLRRVSWTAHLDGRGALVAAGQGSPPLTWGSGFWLRSRTLEVRTTGSPRGSSKNRSRDTPDAVENVAEVAEDDAEATEDVAEVARQAKDAEVNATDVPAETPHPRRGASRQRSLLAPSSSGKDRFVAVEAPLGSGAPLLAAMRTRDRTWIACERQGARWTGGLLAGVGGTGNRLGVLASAMRPGGTNQVEAGFEEGGPVRLALRSVGVTSLPGRARSWWDLEARTLIASAGGRTMVAASGEGTSPDRRMRLRGTVAAAFLQIGAVFDAWSDGSGGTALEARRAGRSFQLRTVARRRPLGSVTLRVTGSEGRTVREDDGERHIRETRRLRLHATADRGDTAGRGRAAASWLLDAGYDRRASRAAPSSSAVQPVREGGWLGVAARIRLTGKGEASLGALDVGVPAGGTLLVTPGWGGGSGFSAGRGGLWGAGRLRWRVARLDLEWRGSWPIFPLQEGRRAAGASWTLACGVDA